MKRANVNPASTCPATQPTNNPRIHRSALVALAAIGLCASSLCVGFGCGDKSGDPAPNGAAAATKDPDTKDPAIKIVDNLSPAKKELLAKIQKPGDVHFSRAGSRALGQEVARHIKRALLRPKK